MQPQGRELIQGWGFHNGVSWVLSSLLAIVPAPLSLYKTEHMENSSSGMKGFMLALLPVYKLFYAQAASTLLLEALPSGFQVIQA